MAPLKSIPFEWIEALAKRKCEEISKLSENDPRLWTYGWTKNPELCDRNGIAWFGRTALHVAVSRGCFKLVEEVLGYFEELERGSVQKQVPKAPGDWSYWPNPETAAKPDESDISENEVEYSLDDLLLQKDGKYKLNALAIAVINCNRRIICRLKRASLKSKNNPYHITEIDPEIDPDAEDDGKRKHLRTIIKEIMEQRRIEFDKEFIDKFYGLSQDFNFLIPREEYLYLFHFLFNLTRQETEQETPADTTKRENLYPKIAKEIVKSAKEHGLLSFLFALKDGKGRTALHVAADSAKMDYFIKHIIPPDPQWKNVLNAVDDAGRTPLHRVAANPTRCSGYDYDADAEVLINDDRTDLGLVFRPNEKGLDLNDLSHMNGLVIPGANLRLHPPIFEVTALHIAIIYENQIRVLQLLSALKRRESPVTLAKRELIRLADGHLSSHQTELEAIQLAVVVGAIPALETLLEDESPHSRDSGKETQFSSLVRSLGVFKSETSTRVSKPKAPVSKSTDIIKLKYPGLHLAAVNANPTAVTMFVNHKKYNPLKLTQDNDSALHVCLNKAERIFYHHLMDFVGIDHAGFDPLVKLRNYHLARLQKKHGIFDIKQSQSTREKDEEGSKKACVTLLLQTKIDYQKRNIHGELAYPGRRASGSEKFVTWWFEKLTQEIQEDLGNLNSAANSIAVTAALVATASYVGPLTPPLGYGGDTMQLQTDVLSVRIFVVCDTISFYLAVASIMISLIPNLPMPEQSIMEELQRTRKLVAFGVMLLFPAIISVIIAFGAASIAVIPREDFWSYSSSTAWIGGFICVVVMIIFLFRLVRFTFYKNELVRRIYKDTVL